MIASLALRHHGRSLVILALAVAVVWIICEISRDLEQRRERRDFDDSFLRMCRAIERREMNR